MDPYHIYSRYLFTFKMYYFLMLMYVFNFDLNYQSFYFMCVLYYIFSNYSFQIKKILYITDENDQFNDQMTIKLLKILDKYGVIKLVGLIVNEDNDLSKSIKLRKQLDKTSIAICGNNNPTNLYLKHNIDIWNGYHLIDNIIKENGNISIICNGKMTSIYETLKYKISNIHYIDNISLIGDLSIENNHIILDKNSFSFKDDISSATYLINLFYLYDKPINIIGKNYCNKLISDDNYYIYTPFTIVSLLRPDLFKKQINIGSINYFNYNVQIMNYINKYINYWIE